MQPGVALRRVAADQRVERAVDADQQQGELAFLALRIHRARAGAKARDTRLADAEYSRKDAARQAKQLGRAQHGLGQDALGRRVSLRCRTGRACHQMKG